MSGDDPRTGKWLLKFPRWMLLLSLITAAMMPGCSVDTPDDRGSGSGIPPPYPAIEGDADAGMNVAGDTMISTASFIKFNDGSLSVSLDAIPLQLVTTEVSRQTGIDIQFIGEHPASTVNVHFSNRLLEQGLRRLLSDANTIFVYADNGKRANDDGQLIKVLILPEGESSDVNVGMTNIVESLSGLSEQIQNSIPWSTRDKNAGFSMNDSFADQTLVELAGSLGKEISSLGQEPELKTGGVN